MSLSPDNGRAGLFPLRTVLFPGSRLPLRIFEQRYIRLVKTCLSRNHGFVIVLISTGNEVGDTPEIYKTGTYVEIVDWEALEDGLLGITIEARYRVSVTEPRAQDDGLLTGRMLGLPDNNDVTPDSITLLSDLVGTLIALENHPFIESQAVSVDYNNASEVCYRLAQLLPVDMLTKQTLLEIDETAYRADRLRELITRLRDNV